MKKTIYRLIYNLTIPIVELNEWASDQIKEDKNLDIVKKYTEYAKARKVIETMTFKTHVAALKYLHLFDHKWKDRCLRNELDVLYSYTFKKIIDD